MIKLQYLRWEAQESYKYKKSGAMYKDPSQHEKLL